MRSTTDSNIETNMARVQGEIDGECCFSHKTYGESFYTFEMGILRNSGYEDQIIVMVSDRIIGGMNISQGTYVTVEGQIRTYNEDVDGHNKLNIVIFAKEVIPCDLNSEFINEIYLEGYLCKTPLQRTSPLGRKICDLMVAVNRMYNKSDYIPCIAWGRNAIYSSGLEVGDKVAIHGRLQSRQYKKKIGESDYEIKTAYEVSILQLESFTSDML